MKGFTHLHLHSEYSLLDGACRIKELISHVKKIGQTSVAITDHGVMYGAVDFYKAAKKEGIKPIIGCEVYVARRTRFDKISEFDRHSHHLVLLCENNQGYQNLIKLVSQSWISGFYSKPRVDKEILKKYSKGLIALSACLAGEIPRMLRVNDYEGAKKCIFEYRNIFGENNFYLELQDHGINEQKHINPMLIRLSKETGVPLVATNDCHYIEHTSSYLHKILLCIQTNHTVNEQNSMEFSSDQFYIKTEEEMYSLFPEFPEAIENTMDISDRCNVELEFGNIRLPHFEVPDNQDHFEYFKDKCYRGLFRVYGKNPDEKIIQRLEYELGVIDSMGYVDYYLIVQDFVNYAKNQGIPVGPGRGSGAGSLAAYCIGITGIDPIKYNLIFERFLNPERISMPDFDIDFCYERRQEVIDYVVKKYGNDHVSQIVTFGTMAAKAAIKDVGRALDIPYSTTDKISKLVPSGPGITIKKALCASSELRNLYKNDSVIHSFIDTAIKLEGMPRHSSTHAAGVVITKEPVDFYVPLAKNDEAVVTQYTMTTLEELGLLKMDFLGLKTLTVISDTGKKIRKSDPRFLISDINENDNDVFEMFSRGETDGVFQFESTGMRSVLCQLKLKSIEDLIAVISLYRPGPMDSIPMYIQNRHNIEKITYKHPILSKILDVTYGCIIYQEQVMQIFRELAGYSLSRADIVRRAMSKKKADVMEYEKKVFIYGLTDEKGNITVEGCVRRGISEEIAMDIFSQMESFASYAFNKSHAAAYAYISYQTAWLKNKYPCEYMASLLDSVLGFGNKIIKYISECRRLGINVLSPNVNESNDKFTVVGNSSIRLGLSAIKGISQGLINIILHDRGVSGKFSSFYDFCKRVYGKELNKRILESMIKSGALDGMEANRRQMLNVVDDLLSSLSADKRKNLDGQIGFFDSSASSLIPRGSFDFPNLTEFPIDELLFMEKDIIKMYVSGHPVLKYKNIINQDDIDEILNIQEEFKDSQSAVIIAVISSISVKTTKSNSTMAFFKAEDLTGTIEVIVFPKMFSEYARHIQEGNVVKIYGMVKSEDEGEKRLIGNHIKYPDEPDEAVNVKLNKSGDSHKRGLYIKVESQSSIQYDKAKNLLDIFEGNFPVYMFFGDKKSLNLAPRDMWVQINDVLLGELKRCLGDKNVVLKK